MLNGKSVSIGAMAIELTNFMRTWSERMMKKIRRKSRLHQESITGSKTKTTHNVDHRDWLTLWAMSIRNNNG